jgi:hypothetical protein
MTDDDGGDARRDDTTAGYTEGDNDEGKAGRGLGLGVGVGVGLGIGRRNLQSQENATIIETVPTPSPIRGDTVVMTVSKATAKPSKGEHRQRGPANGGYGSNSNDKLRLEPRPASEAAVTSVVRSSQTKPPEETNMDVQEMREVGEQQHEPPSTPKAKKVTTVARPSQTESPEETEMGVQERREVDAQQQGPSKTPTRKRKRKRKGGVAKRVAKAKTKEGE